MATLKESALKRRKTEADVPAFVRAGSAISLASGASSIGEDTLHQLSQGPAWQEGFGPRSVAELDAWLDGETVGW